MHMYDVHVHLCLCTPVSVCPPWKGDPIARGTAIDWPASTSRSGTRSHTLPSAVSPQNRRSLGQVVWLVRSSSLSVPSIWEESCWGPELVPHAQHDRARVLCVTYGDAVSAGSVQRRLRARACPAARMFVRHTQSPGFPSTPA